MRYIKKKLQQRRHVWVDQEDAAWWCSDNRYEKDTEGLITTKTTHRTLKQGGGGSCAGTRISIAPLPSPMFKPVASLIQYYGL